MAKEAYYFSHDSNARTDPKIMAMLLDFRSTGYGMYWCIVEMLSEQDEYKLEKNKITFNAIAMAMLCERNAVENFVNACVCEYQLFAEDDKYFWSESLLRRMLVKEEKRAKRSAAGKKGADSRWNSEEKSQNDSNAMAMPLQTDNAAIAKDGKGKESKAKESKSIYNAQVEELWLMYPKKKGKDKATKKIPGLITKYGFEQIKRTVQRYAAEIESKGTDAQYVKQGDTFFNSGYVDYLDENYTSAKLTAKQVASNDFDFTGLC